MSHFSPASFMGAFQTSVFAELAEDKQTLEQQGKTLIDLSIGSPDLPPPPFVMNTLATYAQDRAQYGYALKGTADFHHAVATFYKRQYQVELDAHTEITQVAGSQDGLVHFPLMLAGPGDLILAPDPGYPAYETGINMAGATLYPMPLLRENGFLPDLEQIPEQVARKAKMMFLNFPGNPVPVLADLHYFNKVVAFAKKYHIFIVHDFAYSELVFDGAKAVSFLAAKGAKEVGVEFQSLSKSFNMAGCRIGYVVGNKQAVAQLQTLKSNLDYGVFLPIQHAATDALLHGQAFLEENRNIYQNRRDTFVAGLHQLGWNVEKPEGSMFIWARVPSQYSSKQFVLELMNRAGVVVTPGHAFGSCGEGFVRIALVQTEAKLEQAVENMRESGIF